MASRLRLLISLICLALASVSSAQSCKRVPLKTPTRWGGNEAIEIDYRDDPVGNTNGNVTFGTEPASEVLLQIYRRNHADPLYHPPGREDPLPIAACVTGKEGTFRFDLPNGEYELRASMGPGTDVTHVYFVVRHGLHRSRQIVVTMHVGT